MIVTPKNAYAVRVQDAGCRDRAADTDEMDPAPT